MTVFGTLAVAGCAVQANDDGAATSDEAALTAGAAALQACGAEKFNAALPHYKAAVSGAKTRLAGDACADDGDGMTAVRDAIADAAARAVFICPAFKDVVKTSPFAAPVRKVLGDTLTGQALTGDLRVLRDSAFQNWSGVEALIPGTKMWATEDHGLLWVQDRLEFGADGRGTYTHLSGFTGEEETTPFTYRVVKTGAEKDLRKVIITHAGKTTTYELKVRKVPADDFSSAPVFELRAPGVSNAYTTSEDECSA